MRTKQQIEEFITINHHLMTTQEMADELGITYVTVAGICKKLNIVAVKSGERNIDFIRRNKQLTIEQIAERLEIDAATVKLYEKEIGIKLLSNAKKKGIMADVETLSDDQKEKLADLARSIGYGYSPRNIERMSEPYNQSSSPFGFADKLRGIKTKQ